MATAKTLSDLYASRLPSVAAVKTETGYRIDHDGTVYVSTNGTNWKILNADGSLSNMADRDWLDNMRIVLPS